MELGRTEEPDPNLALTNKQGAGDITASRRVPRKSGLLWGEWPVRAQTPCLASERECQWTPL